ncbi:MAG: hypothetical protein LBG88_03960 [Christensenellaceae bacterium]|jgi:hypothetical protein|nr:hypothetical protein [Christensenellaceae bacterium]
MRRDLILPALLGLGIFAQSNEVSLNNNTTTLLMLFLLLEEQNEIERLERRVARCCNDGDGDIEFRRNERRDDFNNGSCCCRR